MSTIIRISYDDEFGGTTKPDPKAHAATHKSGGSDAIKLDELAAPTDVATLNASTSAHGLLKKLSNVVTQFMDGTGNWSTPTGIVPAAHASTHMSAGSDPIRLDELKAPTDVTTLNVSSTAHGLQPKHPNDATQFLSGAATYLALDETRLAHVVTALTPGAVISLDASLGESFTLVPSMACAINATNIVTGRPVKLFITTSGVTSFVVTFGTGFLSTGTLATGIVTGMHFLVVFNEDGAGTLWEASRTGPM